MPPDRPERKDTEEHMSNADLEARIRDLETSLAATRAALPVTLIPEHGAGVGLAIEPTWSQAEQEEAAAAKPPSGRP